jgi:hypothetical protein
LSRSRFDTGLIRDIGRDDERFRTFAFDFVPNGLEPSLAAREQRDTRTPPREGACRSAADAAGSTRNHDNSPVYRTHFAASAPLQTARAYDDESSTIALTAP